jgi:hypothetical protein
MDKYAKDVEEMARQIEKETGERGVRKKNRIRFEKSEKIMKILI